MQGVQLDRPVALQTLAAEIAYGLRQIPVADVGITQSLIARIAEWGEAEAALDSWWSAYEVINHRLPTRTTAETWFATLDPADLPKWSVDEALFAVMLARLHDPVLTTKLSALSGVYSAIKHRPEAVAKPLEWFLTRDATVSSALLVMEALDMLEVEPFEIGRCLIEVLEMYASTDLWGLRVLAQRLLTRIGQPMPALPINWPDPENLVPNNWIEMTISADDGERLEEIDRIWPEFLERTAAFFWTLWNRKSSKEKGWERYRLAHGRDLDACPPMPVLRWETELLETAIHQSMNGLSAHLWKSGTWEPDAERLILRKTLPRTRAHLALYNSRIPRPAYPEPETYTSTCSDIPALHDDPLYASWRRIAYIERHWIKTSSDSYGPPDVLVSVYCGAVGGFQAKIPPTSLPFLRCSVDEWWTGGLLGPEEGPLVGMDPVVDWVGNHFMFVPPGYLMSKFNLVSPQTNGPLVWNDTSAMPAVRFRHWRIIDSRQLFTASASYEGMDLIVRPDVFSQLVTICNAPIREVSVFRKQTLSRHPPSFRS